jgi:hypothetical protein
MRIISRATTDTDVDIFALLRTRQNRLPTIALVASLAFVFLLRFFTVSRHLDMGCDIATYLATMNTLFGQDATGLGLDRPPLIAIPVKLFTLVFGDLNGVKLLGILLSVAIGFAFYLLARRISHPWIAVAMTIVFVLTPAYSDMLTWGYITMFGILFGLLTLHFFLQLLDRPSKANVFLTGVFASFIAGFHQLSLAFFVPLFLLLATALFFFNRQTLLKNWKSVVAATAVALICSIPYVPLYLRMLRMQAPASAEASVSLTPLYVPWLLGTILSLPIVALALRWVWRREKNIAIAVAVLLLYSLVLVLFVLPPPFVEINRRAHYFMYPAIWLLAGVVLSHLWSWQTVHISTVRRWLPKPVSIALVVTLLSTTLVLSQIKLVRGLDFFGYLDRTRRDAVSWVRDYTPDGASIAAYPESLGWWIEAESKRNTAAVTDRNTVPYVFLQERSLAAERLMSRNQGLENGHLRLATTYPYGGAPGQPVLGVCVGGFYLDVMMFDDSSISLSMESGRVVNLADDSEKEFTISGNGDSMTMTTTYEIEGAEVVQTATLDRGSQTAVVSYNIRMVGASVTGLHVPVFFGFEPKSVSIAPNQRSVEVLQYLGTQSDQVVTRIDFGSEGATPQTPVTHEDRVDLSFSIQSDKATITLSFGVADPGSDSDADVIHYDVPLILKDTALQHLPSIDYLAIDLKPNAHLASELPQGTEEWLNACPYYKLVYSEGDIRIYQVDASALP